MQVNQPQTRSEAGRARHMAFVGTVALAVTIALAGCGGATKVEPSLMPPSDAGAELGSFRYEPGPRIASLASGRMYPAGDVASRMRFIEAMDACMRSPDPAVRADAAALRQAFEGAESAEAFLAALAQRLAAWQVVPTDGAEQASRGAEALITGYATPVVRAKRRPDARFRYPLFVDLRRRFETVADAPRRQILATPNIESQAIAWLGDPLAWALVETNGSARLVFDDGVEPSQLAISRVATNGRPWTGMGRWFRANGLIDRDDFTLAEVRTTAYVHPEKAEMAALANDRVVYFEISDPKRFPTALGLGGARLIPGWSCAADQRFYPPGSILLLVEETDAGPRGHILFVHDAGGAIRGPARVDCYIGEGDDALARAGELRGTARVYRLRAAAGAGG
jgi:membrane-bound lytic murein transglycosylase A